MILVWSGGHFLADFESWPKCPQEGFWAPRGSPGRLFKFGSPQKADFDDDHTKRLGRVHRVRKKKIDFAIFRDFCILGSVGLLRENRRFEALGT